MTSVASEKRLISFRMDDNMIKLVDKLASKIGEDRTEFTRQAWLLRIQHLKNSNILTSIDEIIAEENKVPVKTT